MGKEQKNEIGRVISGIKKGDRQSISRAITIAESAPEMFASLIKPLYNPKKEARVIGIVGPPGCGKSSLIAMIAPKLTAMGNKLGVIAIDASSPFTGGSFLGNRIRMQDSLSNNKIFMRSMASRGAKGGLAAAVMNAILVLSSAGYDYIIVEPVGSGQADVDILDIASTIVLVLAPGLGDEIQAAKAGLMEIGNIFVINKVDLPGADKAERDIRYFISTGPAEKRQQNIVKTSTVSREGIDELAQAIIEHEKSVDKNEFIKYRFYMETLRIATEIFSEHIDHLKKERPKWLETSLSEATDPYSAAEKIIKRIESDEKL